MTEPLLSLRNVDTFYGESHILHGLTFDVFPGEVIGILGRNGVGKTTTLQSILGVPSPRNGEIRLGGNVISGLPTYEIVGRGVGWVPQGHRIFPTLTVVENIELALARARPGRWKLDAVYEAFPRLHTRRTARGGSLSGGEQQMLAIARALIQNPEIFLMDEPSEGLSPLIVSEVGVAHQKTERRGTYVPRRRAKPLIRFERRSPHPDHEQGCDRVFRKTGRYPERSGDRASLSRNGRGGRAAATKE